MMHERGDVVGRDGQLVHADEEAARVQHLGAGEVLGLEVRQRLRDQAQEQGHGAQVDGDGARARGGGGGLCAGGGISCGTGKQQHAAAQSKELRAALAEIERLGGVRVGTALRAAACTLQRARACNELHAPRTRAAGVSVEKQQAGGDLARGR